MASRPILERSRSLWPQKVCVLVSVYVCLKNSISVVLWQRQRRLLKKALTAKVRWHLREQDLSNFLFF